MTFSTRHALIPLLLAGCMATAPRTGSLAAAELWVSPRGMDTNAGTREQPLASPALALRKARELRRLQDPSITNGVRIILQGGVYPLGSPLLVRPEDSGSETSPTLLQAAPGEFPVLSGGAEIGNWTKLEGALPGLPGAARGNVWRATPPRFNGRPLEFRQLWVNNRKAVRAREPNDDAMARLVGWDRDRQEAWIPSALSGPYRTLDGVEMTVLQMWEIAKLRLKSLDREGEKARVTFHQPESVIEFEHPWPQPLMEPQGAPFFLAGTVEFLDQPGEWLQDPVTGAVYYWPRPGEDLTRDRVIAPALETLVQVLGSLDRPVEHVTFQGIGFEHTTWMRPSEQGHVPLQAGMFLVDAYKLRPKGTPDWRSLDNQAWVGRPPAAVTVEGANHVTLEHCRFEHLASTGLDFVRGTRDDVVEGCVFRDIGGNGILLGCFQEGGIETHLPYNPEDQREICTRERIANNLVTDCANEDWGCVGIGVGYASEVIIEHNEVSDCSYTGISLGWGWTRTPNAMMKNVVRANHIHHIATRMSDTAGIYTLSAQPWTVISDNSIHSITMSPYVHDPEHWFYLYLDEGSSFITVSNNWCPADRYLANANGPGNLWTNNGPGVADAVKAGAGLEPPFRDLLPTPQEQEVE